MPCPTPLGGILAIAGVGLLTAAVVEGDNWGWFSLRVIGAVVLSIAVLVLFLQSVYGYSPIRSGLASSPGPVMAAIFAGPAGNRAQRRGHKQIIVPGLAFFSLGMMLLALTVPPTTS